MSKQWKIRKTNKSDAQAIFSLILLEDAGFVRIHKSYVVNLEHITEYLRGEGGSVLLTGGQEIEVSRRKKEVLMQRMKEHFKF